MIRGDNKITFCVLKTFRGRIFLTLGDQGFYRKSIPNMEEIDRSIETVKVLWIKARAWIIGEQKQGGSASSLFLAAESSI